ncbi:MAG: cyclic nucleotide-binding domain-containing protein, partial [Chloroflexota bacterium]|nr:cyclic nucleotide-binding domain-containing protein [Chloroflexota bacterium]
MKHILRQVDIFYDLSDAQLERLATICQPISHDAGELIFQENSASDEMYIVVKGAVEIQVDPAILGLTDPPGPGPTTIATLHEGQVFGEVALVDRGLRSAAAKCVAMPTNLLVIRRENLMHLCDEDPQLGYQIMRNIAAALAFKIRGADLTVREQLLWRPPQGHSH